MSMRIQVEGVGEVEVDPTFGQLSPEEQDDVIAEIQQSVTGGRSSSDMAAPSSLPINAGQQAFDLDAAATPTAAASPVQQTEPPETFGFEFEKHEPVLRRYFNDYDRKEDLKRGASYKEKNPIQADYDRVFAEEIAPTFVGIGLDPDSAIEAAKIKRADPKMPIRDVLKTAGVRLAETTEAGGGAALTPQQAEQIGELQGVYQRAIDAANDTEDPRMKRDSQRTAQSAMQQMRQVKGVPDPTPYETYENIRSVREEIARKVEIGSGSVVYDGVRYSVADAASLEQDLAGEQADALYALERDRSSLRVSQNNATVFKLDKSGKPLTNADGKPVIDQTATAAKWDELYASAKPGELVEKEDGTIGPFAGIQETSEGGDRWTPKSLQPAMRGAREVAGKVYDKAAPFVGRVADNAASTMETLTRPARENLQSFPTVALARYGLRYLSEVGRKAEEEERKKQTGQ